MPRTTLRRGGGGDAFYDRWDASVDPEAEARAQARRRRELEAAAVEDTEPADSELNNDGDDGDDGEGDGEDGEGDDEDGDDGEEGEDSDEYEGVESVNDAAAAARAQAALLRAQSEEAARAARAAAAARAREAAAAAARVLAPVRHGGKGSHVKRSRKVLRDNIQGVTKASIRRLARRACSPNASRTQTATLRIRQSAAPRPPPL